MAEKQKVILPADNYGRVYIGLLESNLSAHAKLCYGVMWSFGPQSWAALTTIAKRMSCSKPTVIKAQAELKAAGWIVLVEKGSVHTSNIWQMVTPAMNSEVKDVYPSGQPALPLEVKDVDHKQVVKQEEKQETLPQAALPPRIAIASFCEYRKQVGRYPSYSCTGKDAGAVKALLKNNPELTVDEWRAGFHAFYKEDPTFTGQHSLSCYANTFNKYKTITPKKRWDQL